MEMSNDRNCYEYVDLVESKELLNLFIARELPNHEIYSVPGDGLCILRAFMHSYMSATGERVDLDMIKESLRKEMSQPLYQTLHPSICISDEVEKYFADPLKSYDTAVCDMFLEALGNAYKVNIKVFQLDITRCWIADLFDESRRYSSTLYFARSLSPHVDAVLPKTASNQDGFLVNKDNDDNEHTMESRGDDTDDEVIFVSFKPGKVRSSAEEGEDVVITHVTPTIKSENNEHEYFHQPTASNTDQTLHFTSAELKFVKCPLCSANVNRLKFKQHVASCSEDLSPTIETPTTSVNRNKDDKYRILCDSDNSSGDYSESEHSPSIIESEVLENEYQIPSFSQQRKISREVWENCPIEKIESLPHDIDGIKVYHVSANSRDKLSEALRDGRRWKRDSRTNWSGYKSVRYKDCAGGYRCPNIECIYYKQFSYCNRIKFGNNGTCSYCSAKGDFIQCLARKYTAFIEENQATIYHYGQHTCSARGIHQRPTEIVSTAINIDYSLKPKEIQSTAILSDLRSRKDWNEVHKTARKLCSAKTISNEKVKQKKAIEPFGHGFEAITELKQYADIQDPFLIFLIDSNEQYVFKTSTKQMKIAFTIDDSGQHFMKNEFCHFDGNHKRVKLYVTLTASVYHPLLKKQVILATMNCKHENSDYVAKFWRTFNEAYAKVNNTQKKFSPSGWITDMASANFNGLATIYGEDILRKVKGCEFHFKQSVERKAKEFPDNSEEFKKLSNDVLYASTPEAYKHALCNLRKFSAKKNLEHWVNWWDDRRCNIFRAFTTFNAPQSNLAEVVHAGWKNREKMGVSLLECCYFDIRDSILLSIHEDNIETGAYDDGHGPNSYERLARDNCREVDFAEQLGRDILDYGVSAGETSRQQETTRKRHSHSIEEGCHPPRQKARSIKSMFETRLTTAEKSEESMKIKSVTKHSNINWQFEVLSNVAGRIPYKVIINNVPSCTCPDYQKNGAKVSCKHLLFVFLFVLKEQNEDILNARHIGDEDLRSLLHNKDVQDKYFMKKTISRETRNYDEILKNHVLFSKVQSFVIHYKKNKTAKCSGCKKVLPTGTLCIRVDGAVSVPYGKTFAVEQVFYFCSNRECFLQKPKWCNVRVPNELSSSELSPADIKSWEEKICS